MFWPIPVQELYRIVRLGWPPNSPPLLDLNQTTRISQLFSGLSRPKIDVNETILYGIQNKFNFYKSMKTTRWRIFFPSRALSRHRRLIWDTIHRENAIHHFRCRIFFYTWFDVKSTTTHDSATISSSSASISILSLRATVQWKHTSLSNEPMFKPLPEWINDMLFWASEINSVVYRRSCEETGNSAHLIG